MTGNPKTPAKVMSFSMIPPDAAAETCGGGLVDPLAPPCDVSEIVMTDSKSGVTVTAAGPASRDDCLTPEQDAILSGVDAHLEMIATGPDEKSASPAKMVLQPLMSPTCYSNGHDMAMINPTMFGPVQTLGFDGSHGMAATQYAPVNSSSGHKFFSESPFKDGLTLQTFFGRFLDFESHSKTSYIDLDSCGIATTGAANVSLKTRVVVHPKDEWEVKLKMPPMGTVQRKRSTSYGLLEGKTTTREYLKTTGFGTESTGGSYETSTGPVGTNTQGTSKLTGVNSDGSKYVTETTGIGGTSESTELTYVSAVENGFFTASSTSYSEGAASRSRTLKSQATLRGIPVGTSVTHNGAPLEIFEGLDRIIKIVKTIEEMAKKMVPKVQFGLSFDFRFMQFALSGKWGRDLPQVQNGARVATVTKRYQVALDVEFLFIELSFGLDIQVFGARLVAKLAINGAIEGNGTWVMGSRAEVSFKGIIAAVGTGEISIDTWFFKAGYRLEIESKITGEWKVVVGLTENFTDEVSAVWSGVEFKKMKLRKNMRVSGTASSGSNYQVASRKQWVDPQKWYGPEPFLSA